MQDVAGTVPGGNTLPLTVDGSESSIKNSGVLAAIRRIARPALLIVHEEFSSSCAHDVSNISV
jgi:hypothetical protein